MSCVNKNSKDLENEVKNGLDPLSAAVKLTRVYKEMDSYEQDQSIQRNPFPTASLKNVIEFMKSDDYNEVKSFLQDNIDLIGEKEAVLDYLRSGKIRSVGSILENVDQETLSFLENVSDYEPIESIVARANSEKALSFIEDMSKRLNVSYNIISPSDFSEKFPGKNPQENPAFYLNGEVYFVQGYLNSENTFHEFSHPVVKAIRLSNPELFDSLWDQVSSDERSSIIAEQLSSDSSLDPSSFEYKQEFMVRLMEEEFKSPKKTSFINELIFNIRQFLRKIFGKKIDISKLTPNTKLKDLVSYLNFGGEFQFDDSFLTQDDIVEFKTTYDNFVKPLQEQSLQKTQEFMNDFYKFAETQIKHLKSDNPIYKNISEELVNDSSSGYLEQMRKVLNNLAFGIANRANVSLPGYSTVSELEQNQLDSKIRSFAKVISDVSVLSNVFEKKIDQLESNSDKKSDSFFDSLLGIRTLVDQWQDKYSKWIESTPVFVSGTNANDELIQVPNPLHVKLSEQRSQLQRLQQRLSKLQLDSVTDLLYTYYNALNEPIIEGLKKELEYFKEKELKTPYDKTYQSLYGLSPSDRAELRVLKSKEYSALTLDEQKRYDLLTSYAESGYVLTKDAFKRIFSGQNQDASKLSGLLESYTANQDNVTSTFYMMLKESFNDISGNINSKRSDFLKNLKPLLKAAGFDNSVFGEGGFGEKISQKSKSFKRTADGIVEHEEVKFANNFKNWEYDREVLKQDVENKFSQYKISNTEVDEDAYYDALDKLDEFDENYMHREFSKEYYDAQKLFRSPIGRIARKRMNEVYDTINLINSELYSNPNDTLLKTNLNIAFSEYRMLSSLYNEEGQPKVGEDLEVAKLLNKYKELTADMYDWNETPTVFENSFTQFTDELKINLQVDSDEYKKSVREWILLNTNTSVSEQYYNRRSELLNRRKEITDIMDQTNSEFFDLTSLYEELYSLIRTNKDEYNVVDGTQMDILKQKRIIELHETISAVTDSYFTPKGFTKVDTKKYQRLRLKSNNGEVLSPDEMEFKEEYEYQFGFAAAELGISSADLKELSDINNELMSLSETVSTQNYIDEMHRILSTDSSLKDEYYIFAANRGYMFEENDLPDEALLDELIHENKDVVDSWFAKSVFFKTWFNANHFIDDSIIQYDLSNGNIKNIHTGYRKSAAWKTTRPKFSTSYNTKSIELLSDLPSEFTLNGSLAIDGVPVVPNKQYYSRSVNDEFKSDKITRDYVDESGELVLANIDNRGNWLPRDFGGENSAKDDLYIDHNYKAMFKNNRALFDVMDYIKNKQLDFEKGVGKNARLYLTYPSFRKGSLEQYDRNYIRRKVLRAKEFFNGAEDDYEQEAFTGVTNEDPFVKFTHPISGNFKIDSIDVSTNIVNSVLQRMGSIEEYKVMRKKSSVSFSLEQSIKEAMMNPEIVEFSKKVTDLKRYSTTTVDKNRRYIQIQQMVNRYINGVNFDSPFNSKWDSIASKTVSGLQRRLAKMSFSFDLVKSLRNYFGGKMQMWKKTLDLDGYSAYDLLATRNKSAAIIGKFSLNRYSNKQLPLELQLMSIVNAIPDRTKQDVGTYGSQTIAQDIMEGNWKFFDRKYLNDSVPVHQMYALMHGKKIDYNGTKKPLYDLVELVDGKIQTKPGVPKEWSISYNEEGEIALGENVKKLMNEHESLLNKNLGISGKMNEPEAYRHLLGKIVFTMMKFFPGMLMDRFQVKKSVQAKRDKKIRLDRRRNLDQSRLEIGTYVSILHLIQEAIDRKGKFWMLRSYSPQSVRGFYQLLASIGLQALLGMLIYNVGFDENDDDKEDFTFDPEMDKVFSRIKNSTSLPNLPLISEKRTILGTGNSFDGENYMKLHYLNLLTAVEQEEKTFNPGSVLRTTFQVVTLQNALSEGGTLRTILDLMDFVEAPADKRKYKKEAGPYVWQEKEDLKFENGVLKFLGFNGQVIDPATTIERRYNFKR